MNEINNVLICGLGAIGTIYAEIIKRSANLKVLVDENRLEKYKNNPIIFNGQSMEFDYILPTCKDFKADLVIIATKYDGFFDAVKNIKNFVGAVRLSGTCLSPRGTSTKTSFSRRTYG